MENARGRMSTSVEMIEKIFKNPKSSEWLKKSLKELLLQDPSRAQMETMLLSKIFYKRSMEKSRKSYVAREAKEGLTRYRCTFEV